MSLTRKMLKAMGIDEEKIDQIIEAHTETVDGLKEKIEQYKVDAEKLPGVQKELDDLKKDGSGSDYKTKYDNEHKAFEDYKREIAAKDTKAAKVAAAREYFESKGVKGKSLDIAVRGAGTEIDALKLENGKVNDFSGLDTLLSGVYAGLVSKQKTTGTATENPTGAGGGVKTRAEIYKKDDKGRYILSAAERQKALAESMASEAAE